MLKRYCGVIRMGLLLLMAHILKDIKDKVPESTHIVLLHFSTKITTRKTWVLISNWIWLSTEWVQHQPRLRNCHKWSQHLRGCLRLIIKCLYGHKETVSLVSSKQEREIYLYTMAVALRRLSLFVSWTSTSTNQFKEEVTAVLSSNWCLKLRESLLKSLHTIVQVKSWYHFVASTLVWIDTCLKTTILLFLINIGERRARQPITDLNSMEMTVNMITEAGKEHINILHRAHKRIIQVLNWTRFLVNLHRQIWTRTVCRQEEVVDQDKAHEELANSKKWVSTAAEEQWNVSYLVQVLKSWVNNQTIIRQCNLKCMSTLEAEAKRSKSLSTMDPRKTSTKDSNIKWAVGHHSSTLITRSSNSTSRMKNRL